MPVLTTDQLAAIGAFLSGVGSALGSIWYVRRARREAREDCDRRLREYQEALHEGIQIGKDADDLGRVTDPGGG